MYVIAPLVFEQTLKYWTSNTPIIECQNNELSEHHILDQNWTSNMSNITKNWTVREHWTVRSKTNQIGNQLFSLFSIENNYLSLFYKDLDHIAAMGFLCSLRSSILWTEK